MASPVATVATVATIKKYRSKSVYCCGVGPTVGNKLVLLWADIAGNISTVSGQNELTTLCTVEGGAIWGIVPLPDNQVAVCGESGDVCVLRFGGAAAGEIVRTFPTGNSAETLAMVRDPSNPNILATSGEGLIRFFDWTTGSFLQMKQIRDDRIETKDDLEIYGLRYSPDGNWLAAGCATGSVYLVPNIGRSGEVRRFPGHNFAISSLEWIGSDWIVTGGSDDKLIGLWNVEQMSADPLYRPTLHSGHTDSVNCLAVNCLAVNCLAVDKQKAVVFSGSSDGTIRRWEFCLPADSTESAESATSEVIVDLNLANNFVDIVSDPLCRPSRTDRRDSVNISAMSFDAGTKTLIWGTDGNAYMKVL